MELVLLFLAFIIIVVIIIAMSIIAQYNTLTRLKNQVINAWTQIDIQLKRRHDLIPNLIETVKGYARHEQETFEKVTKARNVAVTSRTQGEKMLAESRLSGELQNLMVMVESYPELKANENFLVFQEELTSTENKITFARQNYNDQVLDYNTRLQSFPANMFAAAFHFKTAAPFELTDAGEREVPKVSF